MSSLKTSVKRKRQKLNELSHELFCEWNDCSLVFNDLTLYLQHLHTIHAKNESFICQWIGCEDNIFDNYSQFCLHVSYHGFHQKLMSNGLKIMKELGPNIECAHDCSARNVLPELPNVFVCGWKRCFTEFLDSESFYRHVDTHSTDNIVIPSLSKEELKRTKFAKCLWINCESAFTSRSHLREHLRSHTQEKLIACPSCGAMFCNKTKFIDHLYRQSTDNINNKTDSLTIHVSKSNDETITTLTIQVPQQTDESSLPISQNSSILIQNLNSDSELMIIDLANPSLSTQPLNSAPNIETYQCSDCFRNFATQSLLREHSRSHIDKYKCDVCQLTANSPSALKHHKIYRHENERPFNCQFCDLKFKSRSDLRRHIDTHNEEPPFKCSLCSFQSRCVHTFSKHHKETHLAVKCNYVCNECDKKFSRGNNLTRHLISIHKYSLPNGCSRFQYQKQEDGDYRLAIKLLFSDIS